MSLLKLCLFTLAAMLVGSTTVGDAECTDPGI